jgi:hypothetical protein
MALGINRYKARVSCRGLLHDEGASAPRDILDEFSHRPWHANVRCGWDGVSLWLEAENDYDANGSALLDEFSDAVVACIKASGTISFAVDFAHEVVHG